MEPLFEFAGYKEYLKAYLQGQPKRGAVKELAASAGCQPSYLSQVLTRPVHLTPDQAIGLSEALPLGAVEREYFLLLVDHARASTRKLRQHLEKKMRELRARNEDVGERLKRSSPMPVEKLARYYRHWLPVAVHLATSIEGLQTAEALSKRLGVAEGVVLDTLQHLLSMGLVERQGPKWVHSGVETHVDKSSPFSSLHHNNWRQLAVLSAQREQADSLHFTGVYGVAKRDLSRLRAVLLKAVEEAAKLAVASPQQTLVCLNADVFEVV
jgi:uncharacterized protein (TIGR02147 family)